MKGQSLNSCVESRANSSGTWRRPVSWSLMRAWLASARRLWTTTFQLSWASSKESWWGDNYPSLTDWIIYIFIFLLFVPSHPNWFLVLRNYLTLGLRKISFSICWLSSSKNNIRLQLISIGVLNFQNFHVDKNIKAFILSSTLRI